MLATLLVPWPRPRLSSDRAAIASRLRCCLLISNASCGLVGSACGAPAVRKMSLPSPQSHRIYAALRSWSLDRRQRPMLVLRSRCQMSVPFDPPLRKERMVRTVPRSPGSSLAAICWHFLGPREKSDLSPQKWAKADIDDSGGWTALRKVVASGWIRRADGP